MGRTPLQPLVAWSAATGAAPSLGSAGVLFESPCEQNEGREACRHRAPLFGELVYSAGSSDGSLMCSPTPSSTSAMLCRVSALHFLPSISSWMARRAEA